LGVLLHLNFSRAFGLCIEKPNLTTKLIKGKAEKLKQLV